MDADALTAWLREVGGLRTISAGVAALAEQGVS